MIKNLCSLIVFLVSFSVVSQVTNEGTPASWDLNEVKSNMIVISLPAVDIKKVKTEDSVNDGIINKPYRIGIEHTVNYGLDNAGFWTELDNGDRIWRVGFNSKGALNLSTNFNEFFLPEGGKVYLYNDDESDLLGAYTSKNNNSKNKLGSWFVEGEKIWVEYYEPKEVKGEGKLNISSVIHGYRFGEDFQKGYFNNLEGKALNDSGNCNQDVDCPIGNDFEAQRDILKKSVAFLNLANGFVCSGNLINNTSQDDTPYFLTANHCLGSSDPSLYTMRFNWISPTPDCATAANSVNGPTNFVMTGSTLRARNEDSDVMLVELNNDIPDDWDITYAGWDRSGSTPSFVVGIHHPSADIMKICRDDSGVTKSSHSIGGPTAQTWDITTAGGGWELGVTEGGSSGSPLFNQDGLIIGQLFGGVAACSGTNDNGQIDFYGRFDVSWNNGSTAASRLSDWLDPEGTNVMTLDSKQSTLSVNDPFLEQNITIFPNPTSGEVKIETSNLVGALQYEVFNILGQVLKSNSLTDGAIDLTSLTDNIYFVRVIEIESNKSLVKKIILNK